MVSVRNSSQILSPRWADLTCISLKLVIRKIELFSDIRRGYKHQKSNGLIRKDLKTVNIKHIESLKTKV